MRRFGKPQLLNQRYENRPGAYGIILAPGGLLVTRENLEEPEWQLPGGGIDPGETPLQALHREVMEEAGTRIQPLCRLGAYQRYTFMPEYDMWARKVCHIYLCKAGRTVSPPLEAHHEIAIMDVETAIQELTNDGDRHFVINHLRN